MPALLSCVFVTVAFQLPQPAEDAKALGIPYQRFNAVDSFGRKITFYLSSAPKDSTAAKLPIVQVIQGSGCQSLFQRHGERIGGGYQNIVLQEAKKRARVLVVEKPGVKFLDVAQRPGSALGASAEFKNEHTLPRWVEANLAALRAAWQLPEIDAGRTLVVGHSEGGLVAAAMAAQEPRITHVSSLAGGGPTQLFDLVELRSKPQPSDKAGDADRRRRAVYAEYEKILAKPDSVDDLWMGHPYRRWSTFLAHSVVEELVRAKAAVYLAQGTADTAVSVTGFDVLLAELKARGRSFQFERIEGADHGFRTPETPAGSPAGLQAVLGRVLGWFLGDTAKK